ncbi:porin [Vibrio sp. SCSIO 43135]|uniref:porin n=1 Tax=Vibrio sp. SCSIO 43135 TaxID=2819096 RepID=UPI002074E215|nr:porin [Vibrio sp. SCSIO 43135]USD43779.1 porin [Vibrio sp. SCSIO 43135]
MKKTLLALALAPVALLPITSQAAQIYKAEDGSVLNMYGRVQGDFKYHDEHSNPAADGDEKLNGSVSARVGFNGHQVINDDYSLIGQMQYQLVSNDEDASIDWQARYVWAGIDMNENGRIETGRVLSVVTLFSDIGDIFSTGGDPVAGYHVGTVDSSAALIFRQNGTFQYRNEIGNLAFGTALITNSNVDYGYNAAARYTIDMGDAGILKPAAMFQYNKSDDANADVQDYQTWGLGSQYFLGGLYLGAAYTQESMGLRNSSDNADTTGYDFRAAYDFGDWVVRAGYRYLALDESTNGEDVIEDAIQTEVQYRLTRQSSIFLNYTDNKGGNSDITSSGASVSGQKGAVFTTSLRYEW